jgi:hypothetical protein
VVAVEEVAVIERLDPGILVNSNFDGYEAAGARLDQDGVGFQTAMHAYLLESA